MSQVEADTRMSELEADTCRSAEEADTRMSELDADTLASLEEVGTHIRVEAADSRLRAVVVSSMSLARDTCALLAASARSSMTSLTRFKSTLRIRDKRYVGPYIVRGKSPS